MSAKWLTAVWMILGGLALHASNNIICLTIAKPLFRGDKWAIQLVRGILWPLVPIGIAIYVGGILLLIISGLKAIWAAIFG